MPIPDPVPGLVLHYSYLWHDQHRRGLEEGTKNRPCVIVLSMTEENGEIMVTVAPITHTAPARQGEAVEIPVATKARLGLDRERSWVVVTEVNRFSWPGHDLRPVPGASAGTYAYGVVPPGFFWQIKDGILACAGRQKLRTTPR